MLLRPNLEEDEVNIISGISTQTNMAILPEAIDNRVRFVTSFGDLKDRFMEVKKRLMTI